MGAVGFGRAAVFGMSEGRSGVRPFSAKRPEPIRAGLRAGVTSVDPELDEKYWPSTEQVARIQQLGCAPSSAWG
jgi:hypothetical protein